MKYSAKQNRYFMLCCGQVLGEIPGLPVAVYMKLLANT
jgi:hypothetical protein